MYQSVVINHSIVTLENIDKFVDGASVARVGDITFDIAKIKWTIMFKLTKELFAQQLDMYSKQAIVAEPAGALSVSALEQYKSRLKIKLLYA